MLYLARNHSTRNSLISPDLRLQFPTSPATARVSASTGLTTNLHKTRELYATEMKYFIIKSYYFSGRYAGRSIYSEFYFYNIRI